MSLLRPVFRIGRFLRQAKCRLFRQHHFLSFVDEAVMDPRYEGYVAGRIEVWGDGLWATWEIRYFTPNGPEFYDFREKWDFKDVTDEQIAAVERRVAKEFYEEIT